MRSFIPVMLLVACVQTQDADPLEFDPQDFVLDDGSILPAPGTLALDVSGGTYATPTEFKVSGGFGFENVRILRTNRGLTPYGPCFAGPDVCFSLQPPLHYLTSVTLEFDGAGARSIPTPTWVPEGTMACFQAFVYRDGVDSEVSNAACVYIGADSDADGIVDTLDRCEGFDDAEDEDGDGYPDGCDDCIDDPAMPGDDRDGDGLCHDPCPRDFDNDSDGDGVCADLDPCPLDADDDIDRDGLCADVDPCPTDRLNDIDGDGICHGVDPCPSIAFGYVGIDWFDSDGDGICDDDDRCPDDVYDECAPAGLFVGEGRNGNYGTEFGVVDLDYGTYTMITDMVEPTTGMSFGPDGLLYAVEACGFGCSPLLMTIDYDTGIQTTTATSSEAGSHSGFAWAGDGMLYGWTEDSDDFISIDPWTGDTVQTSVGIGTANNCMASDDFGSLYLVSSSSILFLLDPEDPGAYVDLGSISGLSANNGAGCTFHNGLLYKIDGTDGELWEIDTVTMTAVTTGISTPDGADSLASARP